jgi:hypothetical protein
MHYLLCISLMGTFIIILDNKEIEAQRGTATCIRPHSLRQSQYCDTISTECRVHLLTRADPEKGTLDLSRSIRKQPFSSLAQACGPRSPRSLKTSASLGCAAFPL